MKKKSTNQSKPGDKPPAKKKRPKSENQTDEKRLTEKERLFCVYYCEKFNATKSAIRAGYSEKTAAEIGYENLKKPHIAAEIERLKANFEDLVAQMGITKASIVAEHAKIAYSSIAEFHNTWIERKAFESLPEEVKACISEIDSKIEPKLVVLPNGTSKTIKVEYVRIRLYDKQKSLDSITRIMGWDAPTKTEVSNPDGSLKEIISLNFDKLFPETNDEA